MALGHFYRDGTRGRSLTSAPGVGGTTFVAHLTCSGCGRVGDRKLRQVMAPAQIDQKFQQAGWGLDPHRCVDCQAARRREKAVASKPTPAAMKAQVQMIQLLADHFDTEAGAYIADWSDAKVATATGLAPEVVVEFRRAGFGEIKEPDVIRSLRADISALEQLQAEQAAGLAREIAQMRGRLADISKQWAA